MKVNTNSTPVDIGLNMTVQFTCYKAILLLSVWVSVCVCACVVCTHVSASSYVWGCMCMWKPMLASMFSFITLHILDWVRVSCLAWSSPFWVMWLDILFQESLLPACCDCRWAVGYLLLWCGSRCLKSVLPLCTATVFPTDPSLHSLWRIFKILFVGWTLHK